MTTKPFDRQPLENPEGRLEQALNGFPSERAAAHGHAYRTPMQPGGSRATPLP